MNNHNQKNKQRFHSLQVHQGVFLQIVNLPGEL